MADRGRHWHVKIELCFENFHGIMFLLSDLVHNHFSHKSKIDSCKQS